MRLIDADALVERLGKDPLFGLYPRFVRESTINFMPTVDAVKVVRCKDCIHHDDFIIGEEGSLLCWEDGTDRVVSAMGYCERGERRNDETD